MLTDQGIDRSKMTTVYIFYLDYRKAVDSVPHERLLDKLKAFRIIVQLECGYITYLQTDNEKYP